MYSSYNTVSVLRSVRLRSAGHIVRMYVGRSAFKILTGKPTGNGAIYWLPRGILEWCPPERRRNGRPRNSWMQDVTTGMRERERGELTTWNGSTEKGGERK